jgi:tripartite-type tricarboxylate transporter receptor subunit TctC
MGAAAALCLAPLARAQTASPSNWQAKQPIKLIVPYAAGGGVDIVSRILAKELGESLGAAIVVDNRPGASGALGSEIVYNAPPDGYTIEMSSADTHSIYPHVQPKMRFDAQAFTAIAPVVKISFVLMAKPDLPVKNVADVIKLAQQRGLFYSSWGVGTTSHVAMEMFRQATNISKMDNVAYKGAGPAVQALMAGEVDLMMVPTPLAVSFRSKLTVIGIAAPQRSEVLKDVPTLAEQGVNVDADAWIALIGPPKMPAAVVDAIYTQVSRVTAKLEVQKRLTDQAMSIHTATRAEFDRYLKSEYQRWGQVARAANIRLDE